MTIIPRMTFFIAFAVSWCVVNTARSQPTVQGRPTVLDLGGAALSSSISTDGLEIYYLDAQVNTVVATRESTSENFAAPVFVSGDLHPELSRDGLSLYLNQDPGPYGAADIEVLTRTSIDETFDRRSREWLGGEINTSDWERWPSASSDGRELYFARSETFSGPLWEIWVASRADTAEPWGTAVRLADNINVGGSGADSPEISADGLALYFTSVDRPGGYGADDIWVTTRANLTDSWGDPVNLGPLVNSAGAEWQPDISADGSTLYFSQSFVGDFSDSRILWAPISNVPEPSSGTLLVVGCLIAMRRCKLPVG